jgi:hypothetical protein
MALRRAPVRPTLLPWFTRRSSLGGSILDLPRLAFAAAIGRTGGDGSAVATCDVSPPFAPECDDGAVALPVPSAFGTVGVPGYPV